MKNKKCIALLLTLTTLFASACGTTENEPEKVEESKSEVAEVTGTDNTEKVDEEVTLTIGLIPNAQTTDYDDNYVTKLIEEATGINLEFYFFPADKTEAKQKFSMMVAGGEKLPDIVCLDLSDVERYNYGADGYFIPLNDYMENDAENWHHIMDTYATEQQKTNVLNEAYSFDGNMYAYPKFYCDPNDAVSLYMHINQQWLDNLGLDVPTTTEELYTVLKAFKEQDANGNGDPNDEIPMMGHTSWQGSVTTFLLNSFTYYAYNNNFGYQLNVENGQLSAPFVTEEFREGLRYIRKMVEEGLISDLSFSQKSSDLVSIMQAPDDQDTTVGVFVGHPAIILGMQNERVMDYVGIPSLEGPDGVEWVPYAYQGGTYNVFITSDCENPDAAFRLLDAVADEEMSLSMRFGEKDVHWKYAEGESVCASIGEEYKAVYSANFNEEIPIPWNSENNIIWHDNVLNILPPQLMGGDLQRISDEEAYSNPASYNTAVLCYGSVGGRYNVHPSEMPMKVTYNEEETNQINDIKNSIQTYVNESIVRFALGDMDLDNDWDAYLAELDTIGLKEYLETSQTAYDRVNK